MHWSCCQGTVEIGAAAGIAQTHLRDCVSLLLHDGQKRELQSSDRNERD